MKRKLYLIKYSDKSVEETFHDSMWCIRTEKPDMPYLEIEATVVFIENQHSWTRTPFSEKIEATTIIVPKNFTKEK